MNKDSYRENYLKISNYLKSGECKEEDFRIGLELEHFIVDKASGRSVTYFEKDGVRDILKRIQKNEAWNIIEEEGNILGAENEGSTITLEPGAQVEISVKPCKEIEEVDEEYLKILRVIENALTPKQEIKVFGYHPVSKINSIPFIPKDRYKHMEKHLSKKGKMAINMMKGSAATQVSVDFKDEADFKKKFKVANFLSPIIYCLFDNSPVFEGEIWDRPSLRMHIWNNCDDDRSGIIKESYDDDFSYDKYAKYIMNGKPIIGKKDSEYLYYGERETKEIFQNHNMNEDEVEHLLSMFFPDVRAKKYIEIRMADALPYPINIAYCSFLKGIFYDKKLLEELYKDAKEHSLDQIEKLKEDIMKNGSSTMIFDKTIREYGLNIIEVIKEKQDDKGLLLDELKNFILR